MFDPAPETPADAWAAEQVCAWLEASAQTKQAMREDAALVATVARVATLCCSALARGGRVFLAGNGGSAADAQHIASELVGRLDRDRPALAAVALTTDTSALTAISNDYGFTQIFARQLRALARTGDVFIALSTSGRSPNVIEAARTARDLGLRVVGLTGQSGGPLAEHCDLCLRVPSLETARIQEAHITLGHILCGLIQDRLLPAQTTQPRP